GRNGAPTHVAQLSANRTCAGPVQIHAFWKAGVIIQYRNVSVWLPAGRVTPRAGHGNFDRILSTTRSTRHTISSRPIAYEESGESPLPLTRSTEAVSSG